MRTIMSYVALAMLTMGNAVAEIPDRYMEWVFPKAVKIGLTTNEVFSIRERIARDFPIGSFYRTNAITFMESGEGWSPLLGYYYYFADGRLGAVAKTFGHGGTEEGVLVHQKIHRIIKRDLSKLSDETVLRLKPGASKPSSKVVELWLDKQSGNHVYFDEEEMSFRVIVFNPSIFNRTDFFADEALYQSKIAPMLESARKTIEKQKQYANEIRKEQPR